MSKIQTCLVTFGVIIGIVGILHGSAEMLQGSTLVESHSVEALPEDWPNSEFYTVMRGSPVFSLLTGIPYYVLGLLAVSVSTTLIVVSATLLRGGGGLSIWGLSLFALLNVGANLVEDFGVDEDLLHRLVLLLFLEEWAAVDDEEPD